MKQYKLTGPLINALLALLLALTFPALGFARGHHSYHRSYTPRSYYRAYTPRLYRSHVYRYRHHSRIHRSEEAKREFERMTGYPHGRPGYVIDHIVPLACGGSDAPSNMQWQTIAEGKAKDKWERKGCKPARR